MRPLLVRVMLRRYATADTSAAVTATARQQDHMYAALGRQERRPRVRRK